MPWSDDSLLSNYLATRQVMNVSFNIITVLWIRKQAYNQKRALKITWYHAQNHHLIYFKEWYEWKICGNNFAKMVTKTHMFEKKSNDTKHSDFLDRGIAQIFKVVKATHSSNDQETKVMFLINLTGDMYLNTEIKRAGS